jgi:hypothetical protein
MLVEVVVGMVHMVHLFNQVVEVVLDFIISLLHNLSLNPIQ